MDSPIASPMASAPDLLQVLAELELTRRKAELLERRVASWENEVIELRRALHEVLKARNYQGPDWEGRFGDLEHRLRRLERRREAGAEPPPMPALSRSLAGPSVVSADLDSAALVRARWGAAEAERGEVVELTAASDGVPAGASVGFVVRSMAHGEPLAELAGTCDGEAVSARWKIPPEIAESELVFDVSYQRAVARSTVLLLTASR